MYTTSSDEFEMVQTTSQHCTPLSAKQRNTDINISQIEHSSFYRTVFNAAFFKDVGFITKRAADAMVLLYSDLQNICKESVNTIMCVVTSERQKVYAYIHTKYKKDIGKANLKDEEVSNALKYEKIIKSIEDFKIRQHATTATNTVEQEKTDTNIEIGKSTNTSIGTSTYTSINHFNAIMRICKSDPSNRISIQIMSYMQNNKLTQ